MSDRTRTLGSLAELAPGDVNRPVLLDVDAPEARANRRALLRVALVPLIIAGFFLYLTLGVLYVPIPPNTDGEQLGYMGHVVHKGGVLYRDAGDVNMPGESLLHLMSLVAFGNHYWSYRLLDYLLLLVFVFAMGPLLSERHGILAGVLFALIYPVVYVTAGFWVAGQRDYLAAHAVTLAAFLLLQRLDGRGLVWPVLSGLLLGAALLLKPTFALAYPLLLAYDLYRVRQLRPLIADAVALVLGTVVVIGPLVVLGALNGALRSFYEMTVLFTMENYAAGGKPAAVTGRLLQFARNSWQWYMTVAFCGAAIWHLSRPRDTLAITLIVGVVVAGSALSQRKGFEYHMAGELVVLTLLNVYFLMEVLRHGLLVPDRRIRVLILMLPLTLFGLGLASKCSKTFSKSALWLAGAITEPVFLREYKFDDVVAAARHVAQSTKPGQTVWPCTRHLMICTLSDRIMPTRFSTAMFLRASTPSPLADAWREEVRLTLDRNPPELIVLERGTSFDAPEWESGKVGAYEPFKPLVDALTQRYRHEIDIGRFKVFRLSTPDLSNREPETSS